MKCEGIPRENVFPLGWLGEGDRRIEIQFMHEPSFQAAEEKWNKRRERVNKDRVFVKAAIDGREPRREGYLSVFERLPHNKMCLYSRETDVRDVIYMKRFEWDWYNKSLNTPYAWNKFPS